MRRLIPALLAAVALAAPAAAAASIQVKGIDTSGYPTIRLSVVTPGSLSAHPSLLEDGKQVAGFEAENLGRSKSVVLAVDRSQSMAGRSLADATTAARAFVDAKPEVDRVAVVTFGSKPVLLTTFTSATGDAESALRDVAVDSRSGTALYDAVVLSAQSLAQSKTVAMVDVPPLAQPAVAPPSPAPPKANGSRRQGSAGGKPAGKTLVSELFRS